MIVPVSWMGVIIATIASTVIGFLWYSPMLFGRTWMKLTGRNEKDMKKAQKEGMMKSMIGMIVSGLITAFILAQVLAIAGVTSMVLALGIAFLIWFGFIATVQYNSVLYEKQHTTLFAIHTGFQLVSMLVMAAIIVSF